MSDECYEATFGVRLRAARTMRKLRQVRLAQLLGVTCSTIFHYERGMKSPSFSHLCQLGKILGVSLDYLAGRAEDARCVIAPTSGQITHEWQRDIEERVVRLEGFVTWMQ